MSESVPKSRFWLFAAAFACAIGAGVSLLLGGLARTLGAGYSWAAIAFAAAAIVLGLLSLRK